MRNDCRIQSPVCPYGRGRQRRRILAQLGFELLLGGEFGRRAGRDDARRAPAGEHVVEEHLERLDVGLIVKEERALEVDAIEAGQSAQHFR